MDKKKIYLIVGITCLIILVAGITTAWFSWRSLENPEVTFGVDELDITYTGDATVIKNTLYPTASMTNPDNVIHEFSLVTSSKYNISSNLLLEVITLPSELKDESFKWNLYKDGSQISYGSFEDAVVGTDIILLQDEPIIQKATNYVLYIWIDGVNYVNSPTMGDKSFEFNLKIEATQQEGFSDVYPPELISVNVVSDTGNYMSGNEILIEALFSEDIYSDDSSSPINSGNAPELSLAFGDSEAKKAEFVSINGDTITYKIIPTASDNGALNIVNYTGVVYDLVGNMLILNGATLGGNNVSARTIVTDGENYYPTLESAINSPGTTKILTMLGSTNECVVIPSGMDVTIDLSGNTITCNDTTITNNGNITINDSVGTGAVISTEAIAINNVSIGTVTISNGNIKGATYGIYNTTSGTVNVGVSGTLSTTVPSIYATGTTGYGVYMNSGGTLNFNNGAMYTANTSVSSAYYKNNCTLNALSGYHINNTTATLDGTSYKYSHLTSGSTVLQYRYRNEECDWECVEGAWTDENGVGHIGCLPDEPYEYVCDMGSWSGWSTNNPGNQDECQKRTCNLDAEGNITTCGSSSSFSC